MNMSLSEMLFQLYGVRTTYTINPLVEDVDIAVTRILPHNPQRTSFVFYNLSANAIYISPRNTVSATEGIYVAPNGGSVVLTWDRDFELCSMEWYATAGANNSACFCLENIIV